MSSTSVSVSLANGCELEKNIVRENYRYNINVRYKDHIYYKCEDSKALGCKGAWRITPFGDIKDTFGAQHKEHTQSLENHSYYLSLASTIKRQLKLDDLEPSLIVLVRN